MNEQILRDYDSAYGFKYISLRYFNAGGAYLSLGESHDPETHLIPRMLDAALNDQEAEIYGIDYDTRDGSCVRDYIHVRDLAEAHVLAGAYLMGSGKSDVFNLGSGSGYTVLEVAKTVGDITGKNIPLKICERRPGDCASLVASSIKARKTLGWGPKTTLSELIETAYEWKLAFPRGYKG
jgi:UDP-glucose 4-epimerase